MNPSPVRAPRVALRRRPLERVEAEIVCLASQVTAATARLIALVGEFDAAEGWRDWGMRSTAHWLSWRCGVGLAAGREQVRVARALRDLPALAAAFAEGRLSYSKVRALTRFATSANEADAVVLGEHATAAQIETTAAAARRAVRLDDVRRRHAARYVRCHYDDDGSLVGSFRLPPEEAAVFVRGLDAACGRVPEARADDDEAPRPDAVLAKTSADALVLMAERLLDGVTAETSAGRADRFQLALHATVEQLGRGDDVDDDGLDGPQLSDGRRLHPSTARRLTCDCPAYSVVTGLDGAAVHVGRRTRRVGPRLRRAVDARDRGRCRAPGCTATATQIHHVRHWASGGSTCLRNLVSLCDHHHRLVHEGGWTLAVPRPGEWVLLGPAGVTVAGAPEPVPTVEPLPHDDTVASDAVAGRWAGETLDLAAAVDVLLPRPTPTRQTGVGVSAETSHATSGQSPALDQATINDWLRRLDDMNERARHTQPMFSDE